MKFKILFKLGSATWDSVTWEKCNGVKRGRYSVAFFPFSTATKLFHGHACASLADCCQCKNSINNDLLFREAEYQIKHDSQHHILSVICMFVDFIRMIAFKYEGLFRWLQSAI